MSLTPETLYTILGIGVIVLTLWGAILGFIRGLRKSIFFAVCTALIFIIGLLFSTLITKAVLAIDLSFLNLEVGGVPFTTLKEYIVEYAKTISVGGNAEYSTLLSALAEKLLENGTYTYDMVVAIISMAVKAVIFIINFVLSITVLYVINLFIWLAFRPKKNEASGRRPKEKLGVRSIGALIGAAKGFLVYGLFICMWFAGASSIIDTAKESNLIDTQTIATPAHTLNEEVQDKQYSVLDYISYYQNSGVHKVFSLFKANGSGLDEQAFDMIACAKTKTGTIYVRHELSTVGEITSNPLIAKLMNGESLSTIITDENSLNEFVTNLKAVGDLTTDSQLIKSTSSVILEMIYTLAKETGVKIGLTETEFLNTDLSKDFKYIIYTLADVVNSVGNALLIDGKIDFANVNADVVLKFSETDVNTLCQDLSQVGILSTLFPFAANIALASDNSYLTISKSLVDAGIDTESLRLALQEVNIVDDINKLPAVFSAVAKLGIKSLENIDVTKLNEDALEECVEKLFDLSLVQIAFDNVLPEVVQTVLVTASKDESGTLQQDSFTYQLKDVFTEEKVAVVDWKQALIDAIKIYIFVSDAGFFDENADIVSSISKLSDKDISDISSILGNSQLIQIFFNDTLKELLPYLKDEESGLDLSTLEVLDLVKGEKWDEQEFSSVLTFAKEIVAVVNELNSEENKEESQLEVLSKSLTNEMIDKVSSSISTSKFITKNLPEISDIVIDLYINAILQNTFGDDSIKLNSLAKSTVSSWTSNEWKTEIQATLYSLKDVLALGLGKEASITTLMNNLDVESLSTHLSQSKLLVDNFSTLIKMVLNSEDISIITPLDDSVTSNWTSTEWKNELYNLFSSLKYVANMGILDSTSTVELLEKLADDNVFNPTTLSTYLKGSKMISTNLKGTFKYLFDSVELGSLTPNYDKVSDWNNELDNILSIIKDYARLQSGLGTHEINELFTVVDSKDKTWQNTERKLLAKVAAKAACSDLFGESIFTFVNEYTTFGGKSYTLDEQVIRTRIETGLTKTDILLAWQDEFENIFELVDKAYNLISSSSISIETLDPDEIKDLMTTSANGVISAYIFGSVLNDTLVDKDGNKLIDTDFTLKENLKAYIDPVYSILKLSRAGSFDITSEEGLKDLSDNLDVLLENEEFVDAMLETVIDNTGINIDKDAIKETVEIFKGDEGENNGLIDAIASSIKTNPTTGEKEVSKEDVMNNLTVEQKQVLEDNGLAEKIFNYLFK